MESAAALAKELGKWSEVREFYRMASELYTICGRSQPASDALAKGARYIYYSLNFEVYCIIVIKINLYFLIILVFLLFSL